MIIDPTTPEGLVEIKRRAKKRKNSLMKYVVFLRMTLRDRADYEEYLVEVSQLYSEIKSQYKRIEGEAGISLSELV